MGRVKDWMIEMEEDATTMGQEEWMTKHGESVVEIWNKVRAEMTKPEVRNKIFYVRLEARTFYEIEIEAEDAEIAASEATDLWCLHPENYAVDDEVVDVTVTEVTDA